MREIDTRTNSARTSLGRLDHRWRRERATYRIPACVSDARAVAGHVRRSRSSSPLRRGYENLLQCLEFLQALSASDRNTIERVTGHDDRHAGLVLESCIESVQQGAAAGQDDSLLHDVGGEL